MIDEKTARRALDLYDEKSQLEKMMERFIDKKVLTVGVVISDDGREQGLITCKLSSKYFLGAVIEQHRDIDKELEALQ